MKSLLIIIITIIMTLSCFSQNWNILLRNELISSLTDPADSIYIEDRRQLEKIKGQECFDSIVTFNYTAKSGDKIEIRIGQGQFNLSKHKLDLVDTVYKFNHGKKSVDYLKVKNIIDGRYSYGIDAILPTSEIKSLTVKWNENILIIPDTAYSNLYQPHLCVNYSEVESYFTIDNNKLYIYIAGSDGAGSYSVKFVFDKKKYLTRIVVTNEMTDGFDFLDGTAKVDD